MPGESPQKIFIVDDDQGLLRLVEKALQRAGLSIATAASGKDAIMWLARNQTDLMLLDLKLEDIEGKELIHHLREIKRSVPFVVITGQGDERVAVDMMKRGALDYLVKDTEFLELVPEVVERALAQVEKERRLAAAEEALRRSEANLARAQQIAHLGSYEIPVPFSQKAYHSDEIFRIIGVDPSGQEFSADEFIQQVTHPDDRERCRQIMEKAVQDAAPFDFEYRVVRPDGSVRHVQSVGEPVLDADGKVMKLVGALLDITERKHLETSLLEISEREQRRIGQDLHDGLGQHLAGIELMSQVLEEKLAAKKVKTEAGRAGEIAGHVREAISQARLLARGLSPVVLESEGLMAALGELATSTQRIFRIDCHFECNPPVLVEDHVVATHLYRIAQEAVSNAIKHGKTKKIEIRLQAANDRTVLMVKDYGVGLPKVLPEKRGMGLRIMQYRAGMIGGTLAVQRDANGGTSVICSLQTTGNANREEPS
jgi:signal transduction histidine kinase